MATAKCVYLSFMAFLCLGLCSSHKVIKGIINLPKMTAHIADPSQDHNHVQVQTPRPRGVLSIERKMTEDGMGELPSIDDVQLQSPEQSSGWGGGYGSDSGSGSGYGSGNGGGSASVCDGEPDLDRCRTGHPPEIIIPLPVFPFPDISIPQIPLPRIVPGCPIFGCESQSEKISSGTMGPRSSIEMDRETSTDKEAIRPVGNPRAAPAMMSEMEMEHERKHAIVVNPRAAPAITSSIEMEDERNRAMVRTPRAAPAMSSIGGVDVPVNPVAELEHKMRDAPSMAELAPRVRDAMSTGGPRSAIIHPETQKSPTEMVHEKMH